MSREDLVGSLDAIGALLALLENDVDPRARACAQGLVRGVLDFHCAAIARTLEIIRAAGPRTETLVDALARDDLVASMLLLHGLHPVPLESRARAALEQQCPTGWRVDHVDVRDAVVAVEFALTCEPRRAADPDRVRSWAEEMLAGAVPDAEAIELTGDLPSAKPSGIVPVERLRRSASLTGKAQ